MFQSLPNFLGQDVAGTAQGPQLNGDAGVPYSGINYGDVLKTLGLGAGASNSQNNLQAKADKKDSSDINDIMQVISLFTGGLGGLLGGAMTGAASGGLGGVMGGLGKFGG